MTGREYALRALDERRESEAKTFAQRNAVVALERLGQHVSPHVLAGAVQDAGGLDGYATVGDYELALLDFIAARRRRAVMRLPAATNGLTARAGGDGPTAIPG